jgi:hypothetical protein
MSSKGAWWKRRTGKGSRNTESSPRRSFWGRPVGWRRVFCRLNLEELEQRLAPADLNYTWSLAADPTPLDGANLTLKLAQHNGNVWLQLVDNETATLQEVTLTQDRSVQVTGGLLNDVLTIDSSFSGSAPAFNISVNFDGGTNLPLISHDTVPIISSGAVYQAQSFTLTSTGDVQVTGGLSTVGDITLTASQTSNGGVLGTSILANASASVDLSGGTLTGRNITLSSLSTVTVNSQSINLFNGLVKIGAVTSNSSASVTMEGGTISASGNLDLTATSDVTTAVTTAPDSTSTNPADDAAVANSTIGSSATVHVSGGTLSATTGTANLNASNTVNVTTTADGSAGGFAPSAAGGTVGVAVVTGDTTATIDGGTVSAADVNLSATSLRTVMTTSKATQGGATNPSPNATQGTQALQNNHANAADGAVNFAAAVAVTTLTGDTNARISGGTVTSTSPMDVSASATNTPTTIADGSTATGLPGSGVGVAVGIGVANSTSLASLGGMASITAPSVSVMSTMPTSTFDVAATSGASGANVGVAGALAINQPSTDVKALVGDAMASGTDLALTANSTTNDISQALAATNAMGDAVGVGASVALNIGSNSARSAVQDGAALSGINTLSVTAIGNHIMTTTAQAGAVGGTATAAGVGLSIPSGATEAVVGTGPDLTVGGPLTLHSERTSAVTTKADGVAGAAGVGVGAMLGITVANESANATVGRNVNTGTSSAAIEAENNATGTTTGLASAEGAAAGSNAVSSLIGSWFTFVATKQWTPQAVALPSIATPDGHDGVAGAIAINVAGPGATARVLGGATLTVGDALFVHASTTYNDSALADATAVNDSNDVAGAVAIDVATPTANALIDGSVSADSVDISATLPNCQTSARANSGAGSTNVGVAGALAMNFPGGKSRAAVDTGGSVTLPQTATGNVTLTATTKTTDTATADGKAQGFSKVGVGASFALNVTSNGATAEVDGSISGPHNVTVLAHGDYTTATTAAAGATGGTAIAPALALGVTNNATSALVAATATLSLGGSLLVHALHRGKSTTRGRGDAAGPGVAVGADLALNIGLDSTEATIAGKVNQSGSLEIETDLGGISEAWGTAGSNGAQGGTVINTLIGNLLNFGKNNNWVPGTVQIPTATTAEGDPTVAAAAAVNVDLTKGIATVASGGAVTTSTPLLVHTLNDVDATAFADGTTADGASTGIAAALAVNVARPAVEASIAGAAMAPAITIRTEMGNDGVTTDGVSTFAATAWSGAAAQNTGVAGALAINVPAGSNEAAVRSGASLTLSGGDLTVQATSVTENDSQALATTTPSPAALGDGASVAVNVALNLTQAEIGAASVAGAANIDVTANGTHQATTTSNAGAQLDSTAAAAAVSVAYSGNQTEADLLAGPSALTIPGSLTVSAVDTATLLTTADGKSSGSGAGVGAAISVGISRDTVTASLARNFSSAGSVHIEADSSAPTTTTGSASAAGGKSLAEPIDDFIGGLIHLVGSVAALPIPGINLPGIQSTLTQIQKNVALALPALGDAAAISVSAVMPQTLSEINANTTVTAMNEVSVLTSVRADASSTGDASTDVNLVSGGLAVAANFALESNQATIGDNAAINASRIDVSAGGPNPPAAQSLAATADNGQAGVVAGSAGSVALNVGANTTQARVGSGDHLTATGDVSITATSALNVATVADGAAGGLVVGVGASIAGTAVQNMTEAMIGDSEVDSAGTISVLATAAEELATAALAGTGAGVAALAGSIALTYVAPTTQALTGMGAKLDQTTAPSAAQNIMVQAQDNTTLVNGSGTIGASLFATGSASVDAGLLKKDTLGILGGTVDAGGNITVQALSDEEVASVIGTEGLSIFTSIAGSGGLYQLQNITKAYVDSGATVAATGSIVVSADDHSDVNAIAGSIDVAAEASGGASAGLVLLDNDTEAYVSSNARVNALGKLPAVMANNGAFNIVYTFDAGHVPGLVGTLVSGVLGFVFDNPVRQLLESVFHLSGDLAFINLTPVSAPPEDPNLSMRRDVTPATQPLQGLAVTATSRDNVKTVAVGLGSAFVGTATFSAAALITANQTRAYIGTNAVVNADLTNAGPNQGVLVAAGSDTFCLALTGGGALPSAISVASVGAAINLALLDNITEAGIAPAAQVNAAGDVQVQALANEQILAFAASLSGGAGLSLANADGSFDIVSVHSATHAFIGASAVVNAGGNVLVSAQDNTGLDSIAGAGALGTGLAGVGLSFTVAVIGKDTQAFVGQGATVNAKGNSSSTIAVADGSVKPAIGSELIHGVGVEARSNENVFGVAGAGTASALIGASGAVTVAILGVHTSAFVDKDAQINADQTGASNQQTVNVSAADDAKIFGLPVNLSFGILTGGLGVDIGIIESDTTARVSAGAQIHAKRNIDVHALTRVEGDSFIANVGQPALLGLNVTISLYSFRGSFKDQLTTPLSKLNGLLGTSLSDITLLPLSKLNTVGADTVQGDIDNAITGFTQPGGGGVRDVIGNYSGSLPVTGPIVNALSTATPADVVSTALNGSSTGTGTTALVDGAVLDAGGDVEVTADERSDFAQDTATATDIMYLVATPNPILASIYNDRAIATIRDIAVASVSGNAHIMAGHDVLIRGSAENDQTITASTGNNSVQNTIGALVDGSTVTAGNDVNIQAHSDVFNTVWSILPRFDGLQFKDGENNLSSTIEAKVVNGSQIMAGSDVNVTATDDATAVVVGDSITIGQHGPLAGVLPATGIALAVNNTADTVRAAIEDSQVTSTGGDVTVDAVSNPTTVAVGLGIVQASQYGVVGGSIAFNTTQNTIDAHVSGTSNVSAAGTVDVSATDGGTIVAVGGDAAIANGAGAVGASFSINEIANKVMAYVDQADIVAPTVEILTNEDADIVAIAVGGAFAHQFALGGSIVINDLSNDIDAHISGGATVSGNVLLRVQALDGGTITAITGEAAVTSGFLSIGGALSKNLIGDTVQAYVQSATANAPTIDVTTSNDQTITSISLGGSGAETASLGGSVSLNTITNRVDAHAATGSSLSAGLLLVQATDSPVIHAIAGAGAGAGAFSVAGSVGTNTVADTVTASIQSSGVSAPSITVKADCDADILAISGQGSGSGGVAAAGAFSKNQIANSINASVGGAGTDVEASTLSVLAHDASSIQAIIGVGVGATGFAVAGAITLNAIGGSVSAFLSGGIENATTSIDLEAHDDAHIVSIAGTGVGATGVAFGGGLSSNSITTTVLAQINGGKVTAPTITFLSETGANITSIAASGGGAVGVAAGGSDSSNKVGGAIQATITGGAVVTVTNPLGLEAHDDATVVSIAGNGEGATGVAFGAAVSNNTISTTVQAQVSSSQISSSALTLHAEVSSHITSIAAAGNGAIGVAAGGGLSRNDISPTVQAQITDAQITTATVNLLAETNANIVSVAAGGGGAVGVAAEGADSANTVDGSVAANISGGTVTAGNSLSLQAHDHATVLSVAGNGEGGVGVSFGGSISNNAINTQVQATISGAQVTAPTVGILALSDGNIKSIAVGGGGAVGVAANGSDSSNSIGGSVTATISSGSTTVSNSLNLDAHEAGTILSVAGNGTGAVGVAVAGALSRNNITTNVEAEISGGLINGPTISLLAHSDANIKVISVGGSGAVGVALSGSDSSNAIGGAIAASIDGGTIVTATSVQITARDDASIFALGGNGAGAVGAAFGVAVTNNTIDPTVQAQISSSHVSATTVDLLAMADAQIQSIAIGGAGAVGAGLGDSTANNDIGSVIDAHVSGASTVSGANGVTISASDQSDISAIGGSAGGAVGVGAGIATTADNIHNTVMAYVDGSAVTSTVGDIALSANSKPSITSFGIGGGGALGLGVAASVAHATISTTTDAHVSNAAAVTAGGAINILAQFTPSTTINAGSFSGAFIAGFGASAVDANLDSHTNAAALSDAMLSAGGAVTISASSDASSFTENAYVGQGAIVAANAAMVHATSANNASATVDAGAAVINASSVTVSAVTTSAPTAHAFGFVGGIVAVGVSSATASESGITLASVDGGSIGGTGPGQQVGALTVTARSNASVEAKSWDAAGGIGGATINGATATADPTVQASIDNNANVQVTGNVGLTADAETGATTYVFALSIGGLTAGLSRSNATDSPTVDSHVGAGATVNAGGGISLMSLHNTGGGAGAQAGAESPGISLVGFAGADPNASASASVSSYVSPGGTLNAGGNISISSNSNNFADAEAHSVFVGALGAGTSTPGATVFGSTRAEMNGAITGGASLSLTSQASNIGTADGGSVSVGLLNGLGVVTHTTISPTTQASIGDGTNSASVLVSGDVNVTAQSIDDANAQSHGVIAGVVAGGIVNANSLMTPTVLSFIGQGSSVTSSGGNVTLQADHNYNPDGSLIGGHGAHAGSGASGGGVASLEHTQTNAFASATVHTAAGAGATIHAAGNVALLARSDNSADAASHSASGGVIDYGGVEANSTANGVTQATLDSIAGLAAGGDLEVLAQSTNATNSFASADSGGVANLDAAHTSADAVPLVTAALSSTQPVTVGGTADIKALALGGSAADSEGVGGAVIQVGTSRSEASWQPIVQAVVGGGTTLTAGGDLNVQAFNNFDASGNADFSRTVQATANASGGGAVSIEGAEADPSTISNVLAHIGAGASLSAGNTLNVIARSLDNLQGSSGGGSGGVFAKGSTAVNAFMASQTEAITDAASASTPTVLRAGNALTFLSDANNSSSVHASGGDGGLVGLGAAQATVQLSSPVSLAGLGDNTTVNAPSATMQILALSTTNLQASTDQSTIGAIADNESDATAQVSGGQTTADVGAGASMNVHSYSQIADNTSVQVGATSNASVGDLAGSNTANSNADATTNARVHFGSGSSIISATFVHLIAATDTANTSSLATTTTTGLTGSLFSNAGSNKFINTEVDSDPGSHITAQTLTVIAQRAPTDPSSYIKDPQTNAQTVAELVAVGVHVVCEVIGQVVCLWGLICNPDKVCNTITDYVREILGAEKSATSPGSESVTNSVNFNSDVTITGIVNHTFVVDRSGKVLQEDNVTATDGTNPLSVGQTVTTGKIVVSETPGTSSGQVLIEAAGGSTSGSSHIEFDTFGSITIHNDSPNDLYVNNLDLINSSNPPAVIHIASQPNWTYSLSSNAAGGTVDIRNTDPTNNAIVLLGYILNPVGLTLIHNSGGDILASGPNSYVRTRLADFEADQGTLGTAGQRIPLQLVVSMGLSSAIEQAQGYNGVYLDVVAGGMMVPLVFSVNNVGSAAGNVDIKIEDGQELTTALDNVVTLSDGATLVGVLLENTAFNPATAVNAAAGIINLGYTHSLSTGEEVTYLTNGGAAIGGLVDGSLYRVRVFDSTSVQLGDTFAPATTVNAATGTINFGYSNDFQTGTKVVYDNGGGTSIPGLVNGRAYYVRVIDGTTIKLAATPAEATATPFFFDPSTAVDSTANTINFGVADGFTSGQAVTYRAHGAPIQGLVDGDTYYVIVVNSTTIQLAATAADATATTPVAIALNAAGATGRQSIGDEGIPLGPSTDTTTQFLRIALDPSTATGTNHQLVTNSFYLQVGANLIRVQNADVTARSFVLVPTLTPEDSTVVLQNISAASGMVTIAAGTTTHAHDNLVLTGTISSPAGTTTLSTFAGNILNGDPGHVVSARDVVLTAPGGTIGAAGAPIQTIIGAGHLNVTAKGDVYVTEVAGALPVGVVTSAVGNVVLTVPVSALSGNDLRMDPTSSISAGGSVTLLVADNVSIAKGSTITAGAPALIQGDYGKSGPGLGSTITVAGVIYAPFATILGGDENDTINLTNVAANTITLVNTGGGVNVVNLGSLVPLTGGVLDLIQGPLTVQGSGADTMNADDTGSTTAKTGTLTAMTLTGLNMGPSGITYSGLANLNINLGTGGSTGNSFFINVAAGANLPATTNITGGSAIKDTLVANWVTDFNGTLNLLRFAVSTITVGNNFNGTMTDKNPGYIQSIMIGGSLTAPGVLLVSSSSDPANPITPTGLQGDINLMTLGGSIAGLVQTSGNINTLDVGPANTPTTGGVNDVSGQVIVGGQLATASVSGNVSGLIQETLTINSLYIGGSLSRSGIVSAVNIVNATLGNINSMTIGIDLAGRLIVSGTLSMLTVNGGTPGTVTSGQVGTIAVYAGYGPVVAQINENGIQRRIEAAAPSAPFPTPPPPPAPIPAVSPAGITFQYFYEGLVSPSVEGISSTNLANPQLTARVANATKNTGPDQFDFSLVTYNDTAKFNLARLDATGNSGISGIRNVANEGDILTKVTAAASAFFAPDSSPAGVYLPQDQLAGVEVRDFMPLASVSAKTIQAVAFGSSVASNGLIVTGAADTGPAARTVLAAPTLIVPAGSLNVNAGETFRVPFADLTSQQDGFFIDTSTNNGSFDNKDINFAVQGVSTANSSGTGNNTQPSNVARGAVVALVTAAETFKSNGNVNNSVMQNIFFQGDGGSLMSFMPIGNTSTLPKQSFTPSIISTGPLGDVTVMGALPSITAPSIFGSLVANGGIPTTSIIQTTGLRIDPISGASSAVPADLGRVYVATTKKGPVVTASVVQPSGTLDGQVISRGDLISQIQSGNLTGLVAAQGNIGAFFTPSGGTTTRLGGVSTGALSGDLLALANFIGDVTINGGLVGGRIAALGSILGNLTISGSIDSNSVLISGGSIGSTVYGTKLNAGNVYGIVAAVGSFNIGTIGTTNTAKYFKQNDTLDQAVIDAVFSQGVMPLSAADIFDQNTVGDLLNLDQIILNLADLRVSNGKLSLS